MAASGKQGSLLRLERVTFFLTKLVRFSEFNHIQHDLTHIKMGLNSNWPFGLLINRALNQGWEMNIRISTTKRCPWDDSDP